MLRTRFRGQVDFGVHGGVPVRSMEGNFVPVV